MKAVSIHLKAHKYLFSARLPTGRNSTSIIKNK